MEKSTHKKILLLSFFKTQDGAVIIALAYTVANREYKDNSAIKLWSLNFYLYIATHNFNRVRSTYILADVEFESKHMLI